MNIDLVDSAGDQEEADLQNNGTRVPPHQPLPAAISITSAPQDRTVAEMGSTPRALRTPGERRPPTRLADDLTLALR